MPALVKISFTEALLVVLKCTDAINPFEEIWGRLNCFAQPVLTCQHDVKNASSMTVILCKCCPALPFNLSYLLA